MCGFKGIAVDKIRKIRECELPPPHRNTVNNLDVFVTGEAKVDEPFTVKESSRLLQQRNSPPVVLHQIVVGGKDVGDIFLYDRRRHWKFDRQKLFLAYTKSF